MPVWDRLWPNSSNPGPGYADDIPNIFVFKSFGKITIALQQRIIPWIQP